MIAELREWLLIYNVGAFLRVIRAGETNQNPEAYRMMVGGSLFESFSDHPRKPIKAGNLPTSTAAGAYQFLASTWDGLRKQYGFADFSPENQDLGAVALIEGRGAINDVIYGRFEAAIKKCAKEWASLPGSPYGQPTKTLEQCKQVYEQYGGTYAATTSTEKAMPVAAAPIVLSLLPSLIDLIPKLGQIFGSGSAVANRNIAAATVVADAVKNATQQPNLQAAIEAMQKDPEALKAANAALDDIWPSITESGGGGIAEARKAAADLSQTPPWKNAAVWITAAFIPLIYGAAYAVLYTERFTDDLKTMVVTAIFAGLLGSITGFFLGSSLGSQRKDAALTR